MKRTQDRHERTRQRILRDVDRIDDIINELDKKEEIKREKEEVCGNEERRIVGFLDSVS